MGRPTNKARAERAAAAAQQASQAAQEVSHETNEPMDYEALPQVERSDAPPPEPRNDVRRKAMEEIEARDLKSKGIEPEAEVETEKPEETKQETAQDEPEEAPEVKAEETPTEQVETPVEAATPEMVKVKVDGKEFEVPKADVDEAGGVTAYQKSVAAENRLKKAHEAVEEAKKVQMQIAQWIQQNTPQQKQPTLDEFIASKVDIVRFGSPEEASAALKEIVQHGNPRIDENVITQRAVSEMQRNLAMDSFKKEFADVVNNPLLLKLAVTLENEKLPQIKGPIEWGDFYRRIGNEVMSVVGRQSQATATTTTTGNTSQASDKEARKASIVNLPTAQARAVLPKEEKPESREDTLAEMRKRRGIPTG